jgi:tetratricopeptide (TPR) repeat protein
MSPVIVEKTQSQFINEIRASQRYYDDLVKDDSLNATAWCIRGNYYNNAFGQYEKALESYNRSLKLHPGYGYAWFSKGVTLQNMGYREEAEECYKKALCYDPLLGSYIAPADQ